MRRLDKGLTGGRGSKKCLKSRKWGKSDSGSASRQYPEARKFMTTEKARPSVPSLSSAKGRRLLQEETSTGSWFNYLPPSITEFQPALRTLAQPIQTEQLRDTLQQWINT